MQKMKSKLKIFMHIYLGTFLCESYLIYYFDYLCNLIT